MRRAGVLLALLAFGAIAAGCSSAPAVNPRLGALLDDEIALLGSLAECPGPRSVAEVSSIRADVRLAQKHRAEGWR